MGTNKVSGRLTSKPIPEYETIDVTFKYADGVIGPQISDITVSPGVKHVEIPELYRKMFLEAPASIVIDGTPYVRISTKYTDSKTQHIVYERFCQESARPNTPWASNAVNRFRLTFGKYGGPQFFKLK